MDDTNGGKSEQALRLALSYLEKAKALTRECEEARQSGRIQEPEYRSLSEFYSRQAQHAQERIDLLRREHRRRADALRGSIQDTARRQAELADLAAARDIRPLKANRLNRRYQQEIDDLRGQFQLENRLASVQDANELGGVLDYPLDRYGVAPSGRKITLPGVDRLVATAVAVLGSLAVFLPWLSLAGNARPLAGVPALLGFEERIGPGAVMTVMVIFLVLPLAGALFTWIENPRRSGSGMIGIGLAMLVVTAAAFLLTAFLSLGQFAAVELVKGIRLGAILYAVAAAQLALLGLRRARAGDATAKRGSSLIAVTGVIIALAVVGIVFHLTTNPGEAFLRFGFSPPDPATGAIAVVVSNNGTAAAILYVPWPEGGADSAVVEERRSAYGLQLFIQEKPGSPFRLYPASQDCWLRNGRPLAEAGPLEVQPDAELALTLAPFAARQGGINPHAVRILATDRKGKTVGTYDAVLPGPR